MSRFIGNIRQIGIVTRNADQVMREWADRFGIGPFFVFPKIEFENFYYNEIPSAPPVVRCGLAHSGGLQLEVIQQLNDVPSVYTDFITTGGDGFQHLSSWLEQPSDYDAAFDRLLQQGLKVAQRGCMKPYDLRFAYFTRPEDMPGLPHVEISDSVKVPRIRDLFLKLEELNRGWDGRDPIREL